MEDESLIILKELKNEFANLRKENNSNRLKQVVNGVIIAIIMLVVGGALAFVRVPYTNAKNLETHVNDDKVRWHMINNRLNNVNENFKSISPYLPENTHIITIKKIDE